MIAQTEIFMEIGVIVALFGAIIGTIWKLVAHMADEHKHADPQLVVFRETCEAEKRAIGIRQSGLEGRIDELKTDMLREFSETRELIRKTNGSH